MPGGPSGSGRRAGGRPVHGARPYACGERERCRTPWWPTARSRGRATSFCRDEAPGVTVRTMLRLGALACLAALALTAAAPARGAGASVSEGAKRPVDHILVLSLPYVAWSDLEEAELPNLNRLLDESSIADLSLKAPTLGAADL